MTVPVILAGGTGTRLWPLSRSSFPKQFHRLMGEVSLLQAAAQRGLQLPSAHPPVIICSDQHRFLVAEQMRDAGIEDATIILEPEGRNTAPAATVAALFAADHYGDDTLVFLMSADHAIDNLQGFYAASETASAVAASGRIVAFGVKPTRPETGYGYIRRGTPLAEGGFELDAFVEKPDIATAESYCNDEAYSWNSGMFIYPAAGFLEEVERLESEMLQHCRKALAEASCDLDFIRLDPAFKKARSESIDYAIMERTENAAVVPMDAEWDDVGAWSYMEKLAPDEQGNVVRGDVLVEDSRENLLHADSRLVATLGLEGHIVVETADAVMVAPRARAQDVKRLVERLQAAQRPEAETHAKVLRPWGSYETIAAGERFQVKRIIVKPGAQLSLQLHHHRAEHWIVVRGTARVTRENESFLVSENESTFIPLGTRHRLENPGHLPLELIEVQSGGYLGEDDIVRFEDAYGRSDRP